MGVDDARLLLREGAEAPRAQFNAFVGGIGHTLTMRIVVHIHVQAIPSAVPRRWIKKPLRLCKGAGRCGTAYMYVAAAGRGIVLLAALLTSLRARAGGGSDSVNRSG